MVDPIWNDVFEWEADTPITKDRLNDFIGEDSGGVGGNQSFMPLLINPGGRLTVSSTDPTGSASAQGTLYYLPYKSTIVPLYNTTTLKWELFPFSSVSIAAPSGTGVRDIHIYDNAGTLTLQITNWASLTARVTSNVLQDGRYVLSTDKSKFYLGTIYNNTTVLIDDDDLTRGVWNMYNRVPRQMLVSDATAHTTTSSGRAWNGDTTLIVECVRGYGIDPVILSGNGVHGSDGVDSVSFMRVGIGYNTAAAFMDDTIGIGSAYNSKNDNHAVSTPFGGVHDPGVSDIGLNYYQIMEGRAAGTFSLTRVMLAAQVMA